VIAHSSQTRSGQAPVEHDRLYSRSLQRAIRVVLGVECKLRRKREERDEDVVGLDWNDCRDGIGGDDLWSGIAARADGDTDGQCGSGGGGEGGKSGTESGGKKPGAKNQGQKTTIGKGAASVTASGPSAYWTDLVDVDADGVEEDNQFLLDKRRGILYTYREDNYQCADGTSQNGDVLMGIYVQGNQANKPVGSGWYVVAVKRGQCGEKRAGLFGCWFDAKGKPSSCGTARVKEESGELDLVLKK